MKVKFLTGLIALTAALLAAAPAAANRAGTSNCEVAPHLVYNQNGVMNSAGTIVCNAAIGSVDWTTSLEYKDGANAWTTYGPSTQSPSTGSLSARTYKLGSAFHTTANVANNHDRWRMQVSAVAKSGGSTYWSGSATSAEWVIATQGPELCLNQPQIERFGSLLVGATVVECGFALDRWEYTPHIDGGSTSTGPWTLNLGSEAASYTDGTDRAAYDWVVLQNASTVSCCAYNWYRQQVSVGGWTSGGSGWLDQQFTKIDPT